MKYNEKITQIIKDKFLDCVLSLNPSEEINYEKIIRAELGYVACLLVKEYKLPKMFPKIKFDGLLNDAFGGYSEDNEIILNNNCFCSFETIIEDITTLAHELRHYAQAMGKRLDKDDDSKVITNTISHDNFAMALTSLYFDKRIPLVMKNKSDFNRFVSISKKYHYYFSKEYYTKNEEMDARQFSLNMVYDLFIDIKKPLTNKQKEVLNLLQSQITKIFDNEREISVYTDSNQSISKSGLKRDVVNLQVKILKDIPDIYSKIKNHSINLFEYGLSNGFDPANALSISLKYAYNDDVAHKLFRSFMHACAEEPDVLFDYFQSMVAIISCEKFKLNPQEVLLISLSDEMKEIYSSLVRINAGKDMSKGRE